MNIKCLFECTISRKRNENTLWQSLLVHQIKIVNFLKYNKCNDFEKVVTQSYPLELSTTGSKIYIVDLHYRFTLVTYVQS